MPGPITHLKIAFQYNSEFNKMYDSSLYLGAICPDSVNINGHAPKELRWPAHLRHKDFNSWLAETKLFYVLNKSKYNQSYLKGYILHILTDIAWDMFFDIPLYKMLLESGVAEKQLKNERWNEIYGFEQEEIKRSWFKNEVINQLKTAKAETIGTLSISEITLFRDQIVNLNLNKGKPPKFVDDNMVNCLFSKVFKLASQVFE